MREENNHQQNPSQIWSNIVSLQSHLDSLEQENDQIQIRLRQVKCRYNFLFQERRKKFSKIASTYDKVQGWLIANEESVKRICQRIKVSLGVAEIQRGKNIRYGWPVYNIEYMVNSPRAGKTIREMIKQEQERIGKQKNGREDEIRSLKIRISLGEIQLKQLRNRVKKM